MLCRTAGKFFSLLSILFLLVSPARAENHPFQVRDLVTMKRISDPQVSPDGEKLAFVLRSFDLESNQAGNDLWLIDSDGTGMRQLTTHPASDWNPRWSPDGQWIWFLSNRSGSSQVWKLPIAGGEAAQATDLPVDAAHLNLSPDASLLAFSLDVFPECPDLECTRKKLQEREKADSSGRLYDRLFVRHWDTWKKGLRSHLFVLPTTGGVPLDIMKGMDADSPSRPFGGGEEFTFSPDGRYLIFTARNAGRQEPWSTNFDLYQAPVDASRAPEAITASNPAWDTTPLFSPDGKTLTYLAMKRPGYEADRLRIMLMDWPGKGVRKLTEQWDRSPSGVVWSKDGRHLLVTAQNLGQSSLFRIDVKTGQVDPLVEDGWVSSPVPASSSRVVFGLDHLKAPVDLYSIRLDGSELKRLTEINRNKLEEVRMGDGEQFTFAGWNGETVYAYLVKPVDFDPSKKYPVAFLIHGGPQGSFGNHFHYRWNPQTYAGAGYAALMVDFHGSTGYGQDFTDSIRRDWGGKPLEDLQKGLAAALQKFPWLDEGRVAALGASYGGYMINWIAGNWPERFRCLVNHDGIFDMRMMYYATEELWFPEWEHGGPYWENPQEYEKHNPVRFVEKWRTPMLVIHGALDFRVPLEQSLATFTALQRRGIDSRFLYFPDENHWVLKAQNSIQWHETVQKWLDQWLK